MVGAVQPRSDMHVARLIAYACVVLYLIVFGIVFFIASLNGASPEKMIGLTQSDSSDITEYVQLANSLLEGQFALPSGTEYLRTPGYPALLALVLLVAHTLLIVPLIQIAFTAATVALIYLLGVRYFPRPVAIVAATLYMIDPIAMYAAWTPQSESLFMLLFVGVVYVLGIRRGRAWVPFLVAGFLFALAIYVRPYFLYLSPLIFCFALAHTPSWRVALRHGAIFLAVIAILVSPWMWRNYVQTGHFAFSSGGSYILFADYMPIFEQARTGVSYWDIRKQTSDLLFDTHDEHELRSFKYSDEERAFALKVLLEHPFQYIAFHGLKSLQLFVGSSMVHVTYQMHQFGILVGGHAQGEGAWGMVLQHRWGDAFVQTFTHIPRLIERTLWAFIYVSAFFVAVLALRRKVAHASWIICAFLTLNAIAFMTGPSSDTTRYRLPTEPFLLLLGIFGMYIALPKIRDRLLERPFVYNTVQWLVGTKKFRKHIASRYMNFEENCKVLDLGSGTGELLDYLPKKIHYTGIDNNNDYIDAAKKRYGHRGTFLCYDLNSVDELHLGENEFDVILLIGVLHHLKDIEVSKMLASAKKLLKQGGHVLSIDGAYLKEQSGIAKFVLSNDRGRHVRFDHEYKALAETVYAKVEMFIERGLLRIPDDFVVMKMFK